MNFIIENKFSDREKQLLDKLSKPPKCMHDPKVVIEKQNHWQCGQCGLIAEKITKAYLYD
jgi:ribosomal protein S27AE